MPPPKRYNPHPATPVPSRFRSDASWLSGRIHRQQLARFLAALVASAERFNPSALVQAVKTTDAPKGVRLGVPTTVALMGIVVPCSDARLAGASTCSPSQFARVTVEWWLLPVN